MSEGGSVMRGAEYPLGRLLVLLLVVLTAKAALFCWGDPEKIFLRDLRSMTLYANEPANSRRSSVQVPQLQCVGGSAGCSVSTPEFAVCYNRGWDGTDVKWQCKLELDDSYQIGRATLNCEGYDYPEDPYILKGSCSLQYTLEFLKENKSMYDGYESITSSLGIVVVILLGAFGYGFFKITCNCDLPPPNERLQIPERTARPSLASTEEPGFWSRMLQGRVPENMLNSWRSPPDHRPPPECQRPSNYQHPPDNQRHPYFSPVTPLPKSAFTSPTSFPIESRNTVSTTPEKVPITSKIRGIGEDEDNISMVTTSE